MTTLAIVYKETYYVIQHIRTRKIMPRGAGITWFTWWELSGNIPPRLFKTRQAAATSLGLYCGGGRTVDRDTGERICHAGMTRNRSDFEILEVTIAEQI